MAQRPPQGAPLEPSSELEEAEQLAEALRRSLRISDPAERAWGEPEPAPEGPVIRVFVEQPDTRFYAVWHVRGDALAAGLWWGPHPRCWQAITRRCPNGRYTPGPVRLRRYPTLAAAREGYLEEAERHGSPVPPPVHRVQ